MTNKNGSFNFSGKGWIALLALLVLGGGALALSSLKINIDNKSTGGSVGDINLNSNSHPNFKQQQNNSSNQKHSDSLVTEQPSISATSSQSSEPLIDINSANSLWSLRYPIYQIKNDKCVLAGASSVSVVQAKGGELNLNGSNYLNPIYSNSDVRGTITSTGRVNLSISSRDQRYLITLDGSNLKKDASQTIITGKASMPNCPESTFEMFR